MKLRIVAILVLAAAVAAGLWRLQRGTAPQPWTESERMMLVNLHLDALPTPPPNPGNKFADNPLAVELGRRLFFDPRLSANGQVSCSTCHQPIKNFTDGLAKAKALGESRRNTRSIVGAAYSPWQYADGRKDSLWSQALSPLEDPAEHGGNRVQYVRFIAEDPSYRAAYEEIFGPLPDLSDRDRFPTNAGPVPDPAVNGAWLAMTQSDQEAVNRVFTNIGKALAAFERQQLPKRARFDDYVSALADGTDAVERQILSSGEIAGLRLFIGKARCVECHNGPLFSNNEFHNTGVLTHSGDLPDRGRIDGLREVREDEFNCLGEYSDAPDDGCAELRFARDDPTLVGAIRTPSLRNIAETAPYMHKGQIETLEEVVDHYRRAEASIIGHNEAKPVSLSRRERSQLVAFLRTLSGPLPGLAQPEP